MKNLRVIGATLFMGIVAASCHSSKTALQPEALNGEWNIMTVGDKQATAAKQPYIGMDIEAKRLYGCAGCNRIIGSVETEPGKAGQVSFGKVGSTRMLCPDMDTESAVLEALNKVSGYKGHRQRIVADRQQGQHATHAEQTSRSIARLIERTLEHHGRGW